MKPDPDSSMDGWRKYDFGSGSFALHAIPPAFASRIEISEPVTVRQGTPFKPVFYVRDLTTALRELFQAGVSPLYPESTDIEVRADFVDPEGNVFQIST